MIYDYEALSECETLASSANFYGTCPARPPFLAPPFLFLLQYSPATTTPQLSSTHLQPFGRPLCLFRMNRSGLISFNGGAEGEPLYDKPRGFCRLRIFFRHLLTQLSANISYVGAEKEFTRAHPRRSTGTSQGAERQMLLLLVSLT